MKEPEVLKQFYDQLHTPLLEAGIDGVKVDVQSGVSAAGDGAGGGPHISKLYTDAMEDSVGKRFQANNGALNAINCMCHSTENIYRYYSTAVARASEDFFPSKPETWTTHLANVAYNNLMIGEVCLGDWDMFHSNHPVAKLHAAARAVGGSPIYVSDQPGNHDADVLKSLVLPDGSILRGSNPGRPTRDCLFVDVCKDQRSALKIFNSNVGNGSGIIGAFHIQGAAWNYQRRQNEIHDTHPAPITAIVRPKDAEHLRHQPGPFVAYRYQSGRLDFLPTADSKLDIELQHQDFELVTIVPIQLSTSSGTSTKEDLLFAPIGLKDMMNSGGAVTSTGILQDHHVTVSSRGPGTFLAFTNQPPTQVYIQNHNDEPLSLAFDFDTDSGALTFDLPEESAPKTPHQVHLEWAN